MELSLILVNLIALAVLFISLGMTLVGLPGNIVLFLAVLGYAFYDGFAHVGAGAVGIVAACLIIGEIFETFMGAAWAKREKASGLAVGAALVGAVVGGLAGTWIFPIVGSLAGVFLGGLAAGYAAELNVSGDKRRAWRVAKSVCKGQALGMAIKFAIAVGVAVYLCVQMPWHTGA